MTEGGGLTCQFSVVRLLSSAFRLPIWISPNITYILIGTTNGKPNLTIGKPTPSLLLSSSKETGLLTEWLIQRGASSPVFLRCPQVKTIENEMACAQVFAAQAI
jgi:hypothetical protein